MIKDETYETDFLCVRNVGRRYGKADVLEDVSFSAARGAAVAVVGPNGSGKSTLLDIVAFAAKPSKGDVVLDGRSVSGAGRQKLRRLIGYVPQEIALFEELSVFDNLLCWSALPGRQAKAGAFKIADTLNLNTFLRKRVSALSGGMKRRVNLGVAMLGEPQLLVLDEPLTGVDVENTQIILAFLKERKNSGNTIIISGHDPGVLTIADKVLRLDQGRVSSQNRVSV